MNRSLRAKWTLLLMGIVLGIVLASTLCCSLFLENYYLKRKQRVLVETYRDIDYLYSMIMNDEPDISEQSISDLHPSESETDTGSSYERFSDMLGSDFQNRLEQISEGRSMSILIFRTGYRLNILDLKPNLVAVPVYSSMGQVDPKEQASMFMDYINGRDEAKTLRQDTHFLIQEMYLQRLGNDYLYLSADLSNGDGILLRSSLDTIERSVDLANRFYMYVSLVTLVIAAAAVYIVSRNFTQPIVELSRIATRMSSLDFSSHYEVDRKDEIGVLGTNMNHLSMTLERTLAELKSANAKLSRDLEQRMQTDDMRREFLSNVSHELKTPIALIQGYAEGLSENVNDDEESRRFYCEVIMNEASKMNDIVRKLLDLNQLEFGENTIDMQLFDLVSAVNNLMSASEILFRQKSIDASLDAPRELPVWGDVGLVEMVFSNYLSNAIHYVREGGQIRVTITQADGIARVSVFNTGSPIPEEALDKIWDKFYKVDKARTREYGGSGVGLSIVKAVMEQLGQRYGVANHPDGVTFWFELDASGVRQEKNPEQ